MDVDGEVMQCGGVSLEAQLINSRGVPIFRLWLPTSFHLSARAARNETSNYEAGRWAE